MEILPFMFVVHIVFVIMTGVICFNNSQFVKVQESTRFVAVINKMFFAGVHFS